MWYYREVAGSGLRVASRSRSRPAPIPLYSNTLLYGVTILYWEQVGLVLSVGTGAANPTASGANCRVGEAVRAMGGVYVRCR